MATGGSLALGVPTITPSGYVSVSAGTVILSGYVSSYEAGSGSTITLTYDANSFCAKGTVAANATYNSWAGVGFNVNQSQTGASGSTGSLVFSGSSITVNYINRAGSILEYQLWDGTNYWCYRLPPATIATAVKIPFTSLNTRCWDNLGTTFPSGTPVTTVQLVVPGSASSPTPFDYCFLGMTVQ